jgi:chemotaxis response regulator CheB
MSSPSQAVRPPSRTSRSRVLLVEPDPVLRGALQCALRWEGYVVVGATNRRQCFCLLQLVEPHVVLLDDQTPGFSGGDAVLPGVPVVLFSRAPQGNGPIPSVPAIEALLDRVQRHTHPAVQIEAALVPSH